MKHVDVLIVGGGPAGISAAIWCKRLGLEHLLLEKSTELGGQLFKIKNEIIDYPGLYAASGMDIQRLFLNHVQDAGCHIKVGARVLSINEWDQTLLYMEKTRTKELHFHYLILATGAGDRRLDVPGEEEMYERGEIYSASADAPYFKGKTAAFVGGGDRAFEGAIILAKAGANVYIVHRSSLFKARSQYLNEAAQMKNITICKDTIVTEIHGEEKVSSITLQDLKGKTSKLPVDAVFVRIGVKPNNELAPVGDIDKDGLVKTDSLGRTYNNRIYAIGDLCTHSLFSSIASSAGQGAMVAKHLAALLTNEEKWENAKSISRK